MTSIKYQLDLYLSLVPCLYLRLYLIKWNLWCLLKITGDDKTKLASMKRKRPDLIYSKSTSNSEECLSPFASFTAILFVEHVQTCTLSTCTITCTFIFSVPFSVPLPPLCLYLLHPSFIDANRGTITDSRLSYSHLYLAQHQIRKHFNAHLYMPNIFVSH